MPEALERLKAALADRYTIERELGRGGMATVYLATDLRHHRPVALKVLKPDLAATLGPDRFLREIQIVAGLQHPNILPLYDSGVADGIFYYVMPYVDGESVRARISREQRLSLEDALGIAAEVAAALEHAHRHGVVHRDIKPENILLQGGHALVADFGIARALDAAGGARLTETGMAIGTPAYMSPEQATGAQLDERSDVYALGCVVYELLAGDPPFSGSTAQAVLARHVVDPVPPLRTVRRNVPRHVERAIVRALEKVPADRHQTAAAFALALAGGPRGEGALPAELRRRRWLAGGGVAAVLVALVLGGGAIVRRGLQVRHARNELLPEINRLVDERDYPAAFALAVEARRSIPNDAILASLWGEMSRYTTVGSSPPGADVSFRDYARPDAGWTVLGRTPIAAAQIPIGFFRWRLEKPGYRTVELASSGITFPGASTDSGVVRLLTETEQPADMVWVAGGEVRLDVPDLQHVGPVALRPYLLGRAEVTNRAYKAFVDSGGYQRPEFWRQPFIRNGRPVAWGDAMRAFRDATGRPGPASWESGSYPPDAGDLPVGGISWYEAAAFAEFARQELPTVFHWNHAAGTGLGDQILPLSNYGRRGPAVAGTYQGVGPFGTYDMAGNVREWVWNSEGANRYILGGAWDDDSYLFNEADARSPWDRSAGNGVRLMKRFTAEPLPPPALADLGRQAAMAAAEVVSDEAYRLYARFYAYDRSTLSPRVEAIDSTPEHWTVESVSYDAGYGDERIPAYLFLPRAGRRPLQAVVFFPGSGALHSARGEASQGTAVAFLVTSGRAVLHPVYTGSFGRGVALRDDNPDTTANYRDHVISWSKELRRSVEFLATRPDIDTTRLAYYGVSWGASMAPVMLALEPGFKAALLEGGGFWNQRTRPEVDQRTFAPRVTTPTLMLNGRADPFFPYATSQQPLFRQLGTPPGRKQHRLFESGHTPEPQREAKGEMLDWLDRYLGPINQARRLP